MKEQDSKPQEAKETGRAVCPGCKEKETDGTLYCPGCEQAIRKYEGEEYKGMLVDENFERHRQGRGAVWFMLSGIAAALAAAARKWM